MKGKPGQGRVPPTPSRGPGSNRLLVLEHLMKKERDMPTYVCSVPNGKLSDQQKQEIATAIGNRHSEATGGHAGADIRV